MFNIKKATLIALFSISSSITAAHAGTVSTGKILDNYIGANASNTSDADYDYTPNDNWDTNWLKLVKTTKDNGQTWLKAIIDSNFVGYDGGSYEYGDLFLMDGADYTPADVCADDASKVGCSTNSYTSGTNKWQYAFDLGSDRSDVNKNNKHSGSLIDLDTTGLVTDVNSEYHQQVLTSSEKHGTNVRKWQIVTLDSSYDSFNEVGSGKWWSNLDKDRLILSFNITDTALASASTIATRWAMTCANDIIEGSVKLVKKTEVPEPSTILLMLSTLIGLTLYRKKSTS